MSWLSDRWGDVKQGLSSDAAKLGIAALLGGYGVFGKEAMGKFFTSSMLKNMGRRYLTSYGLNTAMGRPHAEKGALTSALMSVPFSAYKNYGLTQDLMGGEGGTDVLRAGTDTPWWKLMLGQGAEGDPELGFMDMFTKDTPTYAGGESTGLGKFLGIADKGPVTGYKKEIDWLGMMPEVLGYTGSDYTAEEKWEQGKRRTQEQKDFMDKLMLNPYYKHSGYGWPGWNLGAKRGGIMQALQGGGDFLGDLMAQEPEEGIQAFDDFSGATEEMFAGESGIPAEILSGIVNQRDPLMQKIMEIIMRMIGDEAGEMPMMGPRAMGEMGDYLGPSSEMGIEEQGDLGMDLGGMFGGSGTAHPQIPGGSMGALKDWWLNRQGLAGKFSPQSVSPMAESDEDEELPPWMRYLSDEEEMATGGDYTRGAHVSGPGTGTSDSINAKLSDGEFVVTANAVKNAGGGDRMEGAKRMYSMMNSLDPQSARPGEEPQIV